MLPIVKKHKTVLFILFLYIFTSIFNITKAVHIDDTAYLEEARYFVTNPLHPMTGQINFFDTMEQIRLRYHPLLIPYVYAGVFALFGESEVLLHVVFSLFTLTCIVFFYLLVKHFSQKNAYVLTALFFLSPFFIPSQNLMLDIPQVAFWLIAFWALFSIRKEKDAVKKYVLFGIMVGLASLTKYSGFILFPLLILHIVLTKRFKSLWTIVVPLLILVGWSLFNLYDYGGIHILASQNSPINLSSLSDKIIFWILTLGAICPFTVMFIPRIFRRKISLIYTVGCLILIQIIGNTFWFTRGESSFRFFIREYFFFNGMFLLGILFGISFQKLRTYAKDIFSIEFVEYSVVFLWFLGSAVYLIIFVPFMAVRHLLMTMPAIFILLKDYLPSRKWLYLGLAINIFLGVALSLSDWYTADIYRTYAPIMKGEVVNSAGGTLGSHQVFFAGHWGWQWYAHKAGMTQYDTWQTIFNNGDYLVVPSSERQTIHSANIPYLKTVKIITAPSNFLTYFRTLTDYPWTPRGFYADSLYFLPWSVSSGPLEDFTIYRYEMP